MRTKTSLYAMVTGILLGYALTPLELSAGTLGSITGYLTTTTHQPIGAAKVLVKGPAMMGTYSTTTDKHGFFRLTQLSPGKDYAIRFDAEGFQPYEKVVSQVHAGMTLRLPDVEMYSSNSGLPPGVPIYESPMLDFSWAGTAQVIEGEVLTLVR